jgi:hypothetical protein
MHLDKYDPTTCILDLSHIAVGQTSVKFDTLRKLSLDVLILLTLIPKLYK